MKTWEKPVLTLLGIDETKDDDFNGFVDLPSEDSAMGTDCFCWTPCTYSGQRRRRWWWWSNTTDGESDDGFGGFENND